LKHEYQIPLTCEANRKENTLVDVDSKSPNFALIMISTYNKVKGDNVVLIYGSKIDLRYEFSSLDWLH